MKNDNFNLQSALQEIKRIKEELQKNRQVQNLLHNLSTSILIISQDLTIIYKNLSAEKKHLLSSNDVNYYTSLLYDEKEVNTAKKAIQEVFETEKPLKNIHLLYKNTNKRIGYLLTNFYPVDNELKHVAVEITEDTQTFKTLAEQSKDVIMRFNKEHQHLYVNPAIKDLLPIEPEDMLGKTHRDLGFPEDLVVMWEKAIDKVFKTKETNRIEFELPENNVWIDWLLMPEFDKNNEVQHVITSARNITEIKEYQSRIKNYSKNLEEKIRERTIDKQNMIDKLMDSINETNKLKKELDEKNKMYELLLRSSIDSIKVIGLDGRITFCNPAAIKMYAAKDESEILGKSVFDYVHPSELPIAKERFQKIVIGKSGGERVEYTLKKLNGEYFRGSLSVTLIKNEYDELESILVITRDITEKRLNQQKIEESEKKYRDIFEFSQEGKMLLDKNGIILDANSQVSQIFGYDKNELINNNIIRLKININNSGWIENILRLEKVKSMTETNKCRKKDGTPIFVRFNQKLITEDPTKPLVLVSMMDVTKETEQEKKLSESEYIYRFIFSHTPNAMVLLNVAGKITKTNKSFCIKYNYSGSDVEGRSFSELLEDYDENSFLELLEELQKKMNTEIVSSVIGKDIPSNKYKINFVKLPLENNSLILVIIQET